MRRQGFLCLMTTALSTFFLSSGLPFLHVQRTMSPGPHCGILFKRPPMPRTAIMYKFLAPLLSAQFMSVATPQPRDIFSLPPLLPPRPRFILGLAAGTERPEGAASWVGGRREAG